MRVSRGRRAQVERNVRRIHGAGIDDRAVRRHVRRTFAAYARYWIESFRLPGTPPAVLDAGLRLDGWDTIEAALEEGNGALVALPHLGGWEWGGFWVASVMNRPITVVVEAVEPPELFEWFVALRRKLGMQIIPLGPRAGSEVLRALKANHVVCLLCDRDLAGGGPSVTFFGESTTLPGGPATLALRAGAPLIAAAVYHEDGGRVAVVRPPLDTERRGRLRDDVARVTQDIAAEFEQLIRRDPDQWHLLQPNWPSDPGYRH